MKKFYSVKLKEFKENIPPRLAKSMLIDESQLVKYLHKNRAMEFRYRKDKNRLDLYADEKYLMMGKLKHPTMFPGKARIGFMELYIINRINRKLDRAKGST